MFAGICQKFYINIDKFPQAARLLFKPFLNKYCIQKEIKSLAWSKKFDLSAQYQNDCIFQNIKFIITQYAREASLPGESSIEFTQIFSKKIFYSFCWKMSGLWKKIFFNHDIFSIRLAGFKYTHDNLWTKSLFLCKNACISNAENWLVEFGLFNRLKIWIFDSTRTCGYK